MRKLIYTMSKNGLEILSTASYSTMKKLESQGYSASIQLIDIPKRMTKHEKELAEKKWAKRKGIR